MATTLNRPKENKKIPFDAQAFLDSGGVARKIVEFPRKATIYAQGDPTKTVMYIQQSGVRLSVVNGTGKEADIPTEWNLSVHYVANCGRRDCNPPHRKDKPDTNEAPGRIKLALRECPV